jgi:hypothetical protein
MTPEAKLSELAIFTPGRQDEENDKFFGVIVRHAAVGDYGAPAILKRAFRAVRRGRSLLLAARSFLPIVGFCVLLASTACSKKPEPCRTAIRSQERSPNGQLKAVVYLRKCPDEVLFTTNVSILPIDQSVPDDTGNTVACPDALAVRVKWQGNNQLTVLSFSDLSKATKQKQVGNVSVDYPEVTNPDLFQPPSDEPTTTPTR